MFLLLSKESLKSFLIQIEKDFNSSIGKFDFWFDEFTLFHLVQLPPPFDVNAFIDYCTANSKIINKQTFLVSDMCFALYYIKSLAY